MTTNSEQPDSILYASTEGSAKTDRRIPGALIGVAVFTVVVAGFFGAWRWFGQTDDTAASAVPADMDLYIGIDALRVLSGDVGDLFDTVSESVSLISGEDPGSAADVFGELRTELVETLGLGEGEDPLSWVGRTAAVALELDQFAAELGGLTADVAPLDPFGPRPSGLLIIESRDREGARRTVESILDAAADEGQPFTLGEFAGHPFWTTTDEVGDVFAVAVTDQMVVAGTNDAVIDSLSLDRADSLAAAADYQEMTGQLSEGRLLTGFVRIDPAALASSGEFEGLEEDFARQFGFTTSAFGMTIAEGSVVFESVSPVSDRGTVESLFATDGSFASRLQADTVAFFELPSVKGMYETFEPVIASTGEDQMIEDLRDESRAQLGFDVIDDFILLLDGPMGLAVIGDPDGSLDPSIPLSGLIAFGTSDGESLAQRLGDIYELALRDGFPIVEQNGLYYVDELGSEPGVYGITDGWLTLSLTESDMLGFSEGSDLLADDPDYQAAVASLGAVDGVKAYVDVAGLVELFADDPDVLQALEPYRSFITGSSVDDRYNRSVASFNIDTSLLSSDS